MSDNYSDEWLEKLNQLSYDELLAILRLYGIKGVQDSSIDCPIARLIEQELITSRVEVAVSGITVVLRSVGSVGRRLHIFPSDAISSFIDCFDAGKLSEFIE